jgi:hypothetical protein
VNGGSARLRILYEHASSVGPRSNSFSPIRRRALEHNGGDGAVLYRSQQSAHNDTESAVQGRKS